jgi:Uma2 family endonuclease
MIDLTMRCEKPFRGARPMSISTSTPRQPAIVYPDSDGEPMAENTLQFRWIVTIKEGLDRMFHDRANVFVAGDLFWYPVEGRPDIRTAPDALVALGRPKGDRGSYKQWEEGGIAPQVVFEVLSPNNRFREMYRKLKFYEEHGVLEYYMYDPDHNVLEGWLRAENGLEEIPGMNGWTSPTLGMRFDMTGSELTLFGSDGRRFLTYQELAEERDRFARERDEIAQQRDEMAQQRDEMAQQRDEIAQQRDKLAREREADRERAERMAAQLRAMGLEPPPD